MNNPDNSKHPRVFISYSHKDKDWVRDWLLPKLESAGIPVHIDFRDFEIGVPSVINMERAVEKCEKTILVLTQNWLQSEWTTFEGLMLQTEDPIGMRRRILPLMLEECEPPTRISIFTYADFRDRGNWDIQLSRLIKEIGRDRRNPSDSEFSKRARKKRGLVSLRIENLNLDEFSETHKRFLQFAIAGFLNISPDNVRVVGTEASESMIVRVEIPDNYIEIFLSGITKDDAKLAKILAPLKITSVPRETKFRQADFIVFTALEKETRAVIKRLENYRVERFEEEDIRTYHCGSVRLSGTDYMYRVVVVLLPRAGKVAAANAVTDSIKQWNPRFVFVVGIAGGVQHKDLKFGDVVIGDQIVGYDYGKVKKDEIEVRDRVYPGSALLLERVRNFWDDRWKEEINVSRPQGTSSGVPKVFVGPIASGDKVVAARNFRDRLKKRWPKLLAVEMEGEGVVAAAFDRPQIPGTLVIRSISDMADEAKSDVWQEYAANAAASFALSFLRSGPVKAIVTIEGRKTRAYQKLTRELDITRPIQVFTAKLPSTLSLLLGRDDKLKLLDDTWQTDNINILSLVAWGGVGKTALVNYWLCNRMAPDNYRGAQRVFGWSFYSQGTREDRQASSDEFLVKALEWFGDPETAQSDRSPWDKGLRLAELVQKYKTLLILDGVEPLQYPPGPMEGRLRDQGLLALLKQLAASNPGLCIITTRQKIADLAFAEGSTVKSIDLEDLPEPAAIELLKSYSLKGTDKELREAARQFGCHALALNLLGAYLSKVHDGEIRNRDKIPQLIDDRQQQGKHARKVMAGYEIYLKGTPELNILYILGLFDRPAEPGAIEVLKKEPPINGLSSKLVKLSDSDYKLSLSNLRELKLISPEDKDRPGALDCHPLVREHFGEKLSKGNLAGWREAHTRLYEYYKDLPEKLYGKYLPDTLEEMQPLFAAVAHGCQAGLHQKALYDVYWDRIRRGEQAYSVKQLGAFGSDLSALAGFFDVLWTQPIPTLNENDKAAVLSWAGFRLRALGRMREAIQSMQASLQDYEKGEKWEFSAIDASNLSELYLTLGEIKESINFAEKSVKYADKSKKWEQRITKRTTLADALAQAGNLKDAEELFLEAENIQKDYQPEYPYLYSVQGFRFCDLLLTKGQYIDVQKRFQKFVDWQLPSDSLLSRSLENLSGGRACMLHAEKEKTADFSKAIGFLNQAVDGLRNAGQQWFLPGGLLARAALYRLEGDFHRGWADLTEAKEIAERGEMKLHLTDYHLEAARLCLAEGGKYADARDHYEKAKALIDQTGYHRRDPDLAALKSHLDRQSP